MLSARSIRNVGLVLVAIVLGGLAAAPVSAANPTPPPAPSRTGIGNWQAINGQPLEYGFQYAGTGLPLQILLGMDPASSVGFSVYTDDEWRYLAGGDRTAMPVGRGTHNSYAVGDLFWQLASPSGGLYHVQIFTLSAGTARFWIAAAGPGASSLTPISPAVVTATPVPAAKPVVVAGTAPTTTLPLAPKVSATARVAATTTVTLTARTPSTVTLMATPKAAAATTVTLTAKTAPTTSVALPAPSRTGIGNWQAINGQPLEYGFHYAGTGLPGQILLGMDPASSVGFSVYTDDEWRYLAGGDRTAMPVGRGTHNSYAVGDLFWQLASPSGGLYHCLL